MHLKLSITLPRLPDYIIVPMPTCLCGSLPKKSVQILASVLAITLPRFPDAITLSIPTCLRGFLAERLLQTITNNYVCI